jgi:hypothetical protein
MTIEGRESGRSRVVSLADVKRASFNSNNELWAFRLKGGGRMWMQSSGDLLSADRTTSGREANELIADRLACHNVHVFGVWSPNLRIGGVPCSARKQRVDQAAVQDARVEHVAFYDATTLVPVLTRAEVLSAINLLEEYIQISTDDRSIEIAAC